MTKCEGVKTLKDGRYRVRVTVTDPRPNGRDRIDRQVTMPEGSTLADAILRREELKEEIEQEIENPTSAASGLQKVRTFLDYAELWLERKAGTVKPTVADNYCTLLENHITPVMGGLPIRKIRRHHVQEWVRYADAKMQDEKEDIGYSRSTRRDWFALLKQVLLDAKAELGLAHDPTERVKPPKVDNGRKRERETLSLQELVEFVDRAEETMGGRYAEIVTLATTGMRVGALYGLKWPDIDYAAGVINVRRSASKGIMTPTTKTGDPRVVPLASRTASALRQHHQTLMADHHPGLRRNLVFPSDKGTVRFGSSIRKPMRKLSVAMGLDIRVTPQVLRRTVNTLCVDAGSHEIIVRSFLGHTTPAMTELYSGVRTDQKRAALEGGLGDLFA